MTEKQFTEVSQWQNETFSQATALSKIEHLKEEIEELSIDIAIDSDSKILEWADCFLLLFGAAASDGLSYQDICDAIDAKMRINRARTWGKPDKNGVVHHITNTDEVDCKYTSSCGLFPCNLTECPEFEPKRR
jgi:hypothetical protein